ncbi:MAG: hypothetical protein WEC79_09100, partial [Thermomicrobiales bacterium]
PGSYTDANRHADAYNRAADAARHTVWDGGADDCRADPDTDPSRRADERAGLIAIPDGDLRRLPARPDRRRPAGATDFRSDTNGHAHTDANTDGKGLLDALTEPFTDGSRRG